MGYYVTSVMMYRSDKCCVISCLNKRTVRTRTHLRDSSSWASEEQRPLPEEMRLIRHYHVFAAFVLERDIKAILASFFCVHVHAFVFQTASEEV